MELIVGEKGLVLKKRHIILCKNRRQSRRRGGKNKIKLVKNMIHYTIKWKGKMMKTIKRLFLVSGFLTLPVAVIQGKDKPQVGIEGLSLGYTSDWIIKLAETT
jgi:hypothetical protein